MEEKIEIPPEKPVRELIWETNYNGKLNCDGFMHIDLAPRRMPTAQELEQTQFCIKVKDGSYPDTIVKLVEIVPVPAAQFLKTGAIAASHGITDMEYFELMEKKYKGDFKFNTKVALYFYLKVKP